VPHLATVCYRRACHLLRQVAASGEEETTAILGALASLREHLETGASPFDSELFYAAAHRLVGGDGASSSSMHCAIAGGAAGVLFGAGRLEGGALLQLVRGHLGAALGTPAQGGVTEQRTAFLRGLMATRREALWHLPGLLEAVDEVVGAWSEEEFLACLPELRLSLSNLTPRETDRVARLVAALHGRIDFGDLVRAPVDEAGLLTNGRITETVALALRRDDLASWLR
jgi:hypothetical protein